MPRGATSLGASLAPSLTHSAPWFSYFTICPCHPSNIVQFQAVVWVGWVYPGPKIWQTDSIINRIAQPWLPRSRRNIHHRTRSVSRVILARVVTMAGRNWSVFALELHLTFPPEKFLSQDSLFVVVGWDQGMQIFSWDTSRLFTFLFDSCTYPLDKTHRTFLAYWGVGNSWIISSLSLISFRLLVNFNFAVQRPRDARIVSFRAEPSRSNRGRRARIQDSKARPAVLEIMRRHDNDWRAL